MFHVDSNPLNLRGNPAGSLLVTRGFLHTQVPKISTNFTDTTLAPPSSHQSSWENDPTHGLPLTPLNETGCEIRQSLLHELSRGESLQTPSQADFRPLELENSPLRTHSGSIPLAGSSNDTLMHVFNPPNEMVTSSSSSAESNPAGPLLNYHQTNFYEEHLPELQSSQLSIAAQIQQFQEAEEQVHKIQEQIRNRIQLHVSSAQNPANHQFIDPTLTYLPTSSMLPAMAGATTANTNSTYSSISLSSQESPSKRTNEDLVGGNPPKRRRSDLPKVKNPTTATLSSSIPLPTNRSPSVSNHSSPLEAPQKEEEMKEEEADEEEEVEEDDDDEEEEDEEEAVELEEEMNQEESSHSGYHSRGSSEEDQENYQFLVTHDLLTEQQQADLEELQSTSTSNILPPPNNYFKYSHAISPSIAATLQAQQAMLAGKPTSYPTASPALLSTLSSRNLDPKSPQYRQYQQKLKEQFEKRLIEMKGKRIVQMNTTSGNPLSPLLQSELEGRSAMGESTGKAAPARKRTRDRSKLKPTLTPAELAALASAPPPEPRKPKRGRRSKHTVQDPHLLELVPKNLKRDNKTKAFVCQIPGCGQFFKRLEHLQRHILMHTGEKPYKCHLCTKGFSRADNLKQHLVVHERGPNAPGSPSSSNQEPSSDADPATLHSPPSSSSSSSGHRGKQPDIVKYNG